MRVCEGCLGDVDGCISIRGREGGKEGLDLFLKIFLFEIRSSGF